MTCKDNGCAPDKHMGLAPKSVRHVHTVISRRLGHASVVITLSIYAHVSEQDDQAAAELAASSIYGA